MHHEDPVAHEETQTTEYWSGGVLECWALLRRSNTASLPSLTYLRRFAGPTLTTTRRTRSSDRFSKQFSSSWLRGLRVLRAATLSLVAFPAALWLTGCMLGPNYKRPSAEIPPQFRAAMTPDAVPSIADLKWFEVFEDEHLQELIRVALVQNYDLRDAIARVDQARANLGITRSNQFPNFNLGGGVTGRELSTNGEFSIPPGSSVFSRQRTFGEGFVSLLSFEFDIWGRLRRATESAQAQLLASDWNRKTVITTLISDVATAYFNLLELDMELAIARDTLGTRQESLRLLRAQLQGGVGTLLDVRQGEQLVYGAAETIPSTKQQIEQTENQISLLLGKNPGPVNRGRPLTEQLT